MSDLSNLLGDVYGDHSPDAPPVRREASAAERAPEWSSESQLDRAFDGWVPGEPPAARGDDLSATLSAALSTPAPAPAPMPTLAQALADAPAVPRAGWTSSGVPAPAPTMVSTPVSTGGFWRPGDDDIFPVARGGAKKSKK